MWIAEHYEFAKRKKNQNYQGRFLHPFEAWCLPLLSRLSSNTSKLPDLENPAIGVNSLFFIPENLSNYGTLTLFSSTFIQSCIIES